jgi:hypothetical protein
MLPRSTTTSDLMQGNAGANISHCIAHALPNTAPGQTVMQCNAHLNVFRFNAKALRHASKRGVQLCADAPWCIIGVMPGLVPLQCLVAISIMHCRLLCKLNYHLQAMQ